MGTWGSPRVLRWWPMLLGPVVVGLVLLVRDTGLGEQVRVHDNGPIPPTLPLLAGVLAFAGAWWRRNPLLWLMGALGLLFFLREASLPGTDDHLPFIKKGVYVGLALLVAWTWAWRRRIGPWVRSAGVLPAGLAMWGMYVLSQMIARSALLFISEIQDASGRTMRTPVEEACETAGHLLLLGIVVAGLLTRRPPEAEPPEAEPPVTTAPPEAQPPGDEAAAVSETAERPGGGGGPGL